MPRTSTTGAGENEPKNGIAVVTHAAGTNQPSPVLGRRNFTGSFVRDHRKTIATSAMPTALSRRSVAVGSPGSSGTAPAPAIAMSSAITQNRRVRRISSRSIASSGEVIVVDELAAVVTRGAARCRGAVVAAVAVASSSTSSSPTLPSG